ncbi:MAG TPA: hypothetical protein VFO41_12650, partial [Alphaproteobacteria bacterium]|nr:hypothetical protein [Alphaproteobacteria bacterium]
MPRFAFFILISTMLCAGCAAPAGDPATASVNAAEPSAESLTRMADHMRAGGDLPTAITFYQRAAAIAGSDPVPLVRLGDALIQSAEPAKA